MKIFIKPFILFLLALTITACSSSTNSTGSQITIIGIITEADSNSILVEEDTTVNEPTEEGGDKLWFSFTDETEFFKRTNTGSITKADRKELEIGMKVKGWANGFVRQSYPAQAGAEKIVIRNN